MENGIKIIKRKNPNFRFPVYSLHYSFEPIRFSDILRHGIVAVSNVGENAFYKNTDETQGFIDFIKHTLSVIKTSNPYHHYWDERTDDLEEYNATKRPKEFIDIFLGYNIHLVPKGTKAKTIIADVKRRINSDQKIKSECICSVLSKLTPEEIKSLELKYKTNKIQSLIEQVSIDDIDNYYIMSYYCKTYGAFFRPIDIIEKFTWNEFYATHKFHSRFCVKDLLNISNAGRLWKITPRYNWDSCFNKISSLKHRFGLKNIGSFIYLTDKQLDEWIYGEYEDISLKEQSFYLQGNIDCLTQIEKNNTLYYAEVIVKNIPNDDLKDLLKEYGITARGTKFDMVLQLIDRLHELYLSYEPMVDSFFRENTFVFTWDKNTIPSGIKRNCDHVDIISCLKLKGKVFEGYKENLINLLLLAMYVSKHLRGSILDPDYSNDISRVNNTLRDIIINDIPMQLIFLKIKGENIYDNS